MNVKEHYDNHLANFYSWMVGDFTKKQLEQENFFRSNNIAPFKTKYAIDLGAGHGLQSVSLAKLGFSVTAVDFNKQLLNELEINKGVYAIKAVEDDLLNFLKNNASKADVIVCMGDTLTHLESYTAVRDLIKEIGNHLEVNGKIVLSFRDLTKALEGKQRFIPIKSDDNQILTCFLEYYNDHVMVHDILNVRENNEWVQKISAYPKLRISENMILEEFAKNNLILEKSETIQRMVYMIGKKA